MLSTITYTDDLPLSRTGGCACLWRIKIHPKYRDDAGLREHELVHVDQFWRLAFLSAPLLVVLGLLIGDLGGIPGWLATPAAMALHPLLYRFSAGYRLRCEVEAYQVQATFYLDDRRPTFASFIAERYGIDISAAAALRLLGQGAGNGEPKGRVYDFAHGSQTVTAAKGRCPVS